MLYIIEKHILSICKSKGVWLRIYVIIYAYSLHHVAYNLHFLNVDTPDMVGKYFLSLKTQ